MTRHLKEKKAYAVLLLAYPQDFRERFGAEMIDTFAEEIHVQRKLNGLHGVARAWCAAVWEVVFVAGPLQLRSSMAPAILFSLLASSAFTLAFFAGVTPHCTK